MSTRRTRRPRAYSRSAASNASASSTTAGSSMPSRADGSDVALPPLGVCQIRERILVAGLRLPERVEVAQHEVDRLGAGDEAVAGDDRLRPELGEAVEEP